MKTFALILALVAGAAAAQNDGPLGTITQDGKKIEVFDTQASCDLNGALDAFRIPASTPDRPYDIGCWKPINDTSAMVVFKDGSTVVFRRSDLVRPSAAPRISL